MWGGRGNLGKGLGEIGQGLEKQAERGEGLVLGFSVRPEAGKQVGAVRETGRLRRVLLLPYSPVLHFCAPSHPGWGTCYWAGPAWSLGPASS